MYLIIGLLIGGIVISGFMAVKTGREERASENEWIEQEGNVFIARMHEEKERKVEKSASEA